MIAQWLHGILSATLLDLHTLHKTDTEENIRKHSPPFGHSFYIATELTLRIKYWNIIRVILLVW